MSNKKDGVKLQIMNMYTHAWLGSHHQETGKRGFINQC